MQKGKVKSKKNGFLTWPNMALTKHGIKDQKLVSFGGKPNRGEEEKERRREEEEGGEEKKKRREEES